MTKGGEAKLDTFQQKCLRRLLKSSGLCKCQWRGAQRNYQWTSTRKKWIWIGHVLRMDNSPPLRSCNDVGTRRKAQERKTQRNMLTKPRWWWWWWNIKRILVHDSTNWEHNRRERVNDDGWLLLGRSRAGGSWQCLREVNQFWPYFPYGEMELELIPSSVMIRATR